MGVNIVKLTYVTYIKTNYKITFLYLGGNEQATHEYISKMLGKKPLTRERADLPKDAMAAAVQTIKTQGVSY